MIETQRPYIFCHPELISFGFIILYVYYTYTVLVNNMMVLRITVASVGVSYDGGPLSPYPIYGWV